MARVKICEICGKKFSPRNVNQKYCSDNCRQIRMQLHNAEYYAEHRDDKNFRLKKAANSRNWYNRHKEDKK